MTGPLPSGLITGIDGEAGTIGLAGTGAGGLVMVTGRLGTLLVV